MEQRETLIVVPTYEERENLRLLVPRIAASAPTAHVLVVDDDSPDGTADEARRLAGEVSIPVEVVVRREQRGLGGAYTAGLRAGLERGFARVFTMDADLSHDPAHIPAMLAALDDHDLVVGSRHIVDGGVVNWPLRRVLLSWTANRFARFLLGVPGADLTSGFRVYRRELLARLDLAAVRSDGYSYLVEMLYLAHRSGARIGAVPIVFFDRRLGASKISKREIYRGAYHLLRLRFSR